MTAPTSPEEIFTGMLEAFQLHQIDVHTNVTDTPAGKVAKVGLALTGVPIQGGQVKTYVTFVDVDVAEQLGGPLAQAAAQARQEAQAGLITARTMADAEQVVQALRGAGA